MKRAAGIGSLFLPFLAALVGAQDAPLVLLTGSEIGTYHRFGQAISAIVEASGSGIRIIPQPSRGSVDNMRGLAAGDADLAIVQSDMAYAAARGEEPFSSRSIANVQALMGLFYEDLLVIARRDLHLRSASGIQPGFRVVVGARESGTYANARHVLEASGLSLNALSVIYMEPRRAIPLLAADSVDVVFLTAGLDDALLETIEQHDAELVTLGPELITMLRRARPYYQEAVIETNAGEVATVRIRAYLVARNTLPPRQATEIVQALTENLGELRGSHPRGAQILPTNLADTRAVPPNPAAQRHYCSIGLRACGNTLVWLVLVAFLIAGAAVTVWVSSAARTLLLRRAPRLSRSMLGPYGVTDRYRFFVIPILIVAIMLAGSLVVQRAERAYSQTNNVHSDFEDLGLNQNLVWMLVFSATGFEDGRFPRSPAGKITSALLGWVGIGSILLLVGLVTSDKVARHMKLRLQSHPDRLRDHVIVCGWNPRAPVIIRELTTLELGPRRQQVAIVCERGGDLLQEHALDEDIVLHMQGDPTEPRTLDKIGVDRAHTVLILADDGAADSDARVLLTLVMIETRAHRLWKSGKRRTKLRTVVEIVEPRHTSLLREAHAGVVVCASEFDARLLSNSILNPAVSGFLNGVLTTGEGDEIIEVPITGREKSRVVGLTFDEILSASRPHGLLLLAINQGGAPGALSAGEQQARLTETGTTLVRPRLVSNPSTKADREYLVAPGDSLLFLADSEQALMPIFGSASEWQAAFAQ